MLVAILAIVTLTDANALLLLLGLVPLMFIQRPARFAIMVAVLLAISPAT